MATAVLSTNFAAAERPSALTMAAKRFVNALVSNRVDAAERELRRRGGYLHETALIHGDFRKIDLNKADLLPFTA